MTKLTSTNRPRLEIAGPDLVEPISVLPYAEIANVLNSFWKGVEIDLIIFFFKFLDKSTPYATLLGCYYQRKGVVYSEIYI